MMCNAHVCDIDDSPTPRLLPYTAAITECKMSKAHALGIELMSPLLTTYPTNTLVCASQKLILKRPYLGPVQMLTFGCSFIHCIFSP